MDNQIGEGNFSEVRIEILEALNTFHTHVRYTVTLITTVLAGSVASIKYVDAIGMASKDLVSALLFLLVPVLAHFSIQICRRYYKIYAANYIYYARIHASKSDLIEHPWVADLENTQGINQALLNKPEALDHFIDHKDTSDPNSWYYYRKIIYSLGILGGLGFISMIGQIVLTLF